tara:strand:+ start:331 stop:660 length:330 start_codon:yes stop_codon:yes gene_type:complete
MKYYKYTEIEEHFSDFLAEQPAEWIDSNIDDMHHHAFNTDYFVIGTWEAEQWLGQSVFEVIGVIKEYEQDNFGLVTTDFSNPENIVNMYAYIVGEVVVADWRESLELIA